MLRLRYCSRFERGGRALYHPHRVQRRQGARRVLPHALQPRCRWRQLARRSAGLSRRCAEH